MKFLKGKKTVIGSLLVSLLSAIYFLDLLPDDAATWMTEARYMAVGGMIAGLTGVSMRLGMKK